jgi:transcriptional regulator with XRE-family HTH domain
MIGDNIKRIRIARKLTINDLAIKSKVARSTLSETENNKSIPSIDTAQKIANALNVNIDDLIKKRSLVVPQIADMTVQECILICKDKMDINNNSAETKDYLQLLVWLEELQELREFKKKIMKVIND